MPFPIPPLPYTSQSSDPYAQALQCSLQESLEPVLAKFLENDTKDDRRGRGSVSLVYSGFEAQTPASPPPTSADPGSQTQPPRAGPPSLIPHLSLSFSSSSRKVAPAPLSVSTPGTEADTPGSLANTLSPRSEASANGVPASPRGATSSPRPESRPLGAMGIPMLRFGSSFNQKRMAGETDEGDEEEVPRGTQDILTGRFATPRTARDASTRRPVVEPFPGDDDDDRSQASADDVSVTGDRDDEDDRLKRKVTPRIDTSGPPSRRPSANEDEGEDDVPRGSQAFVGIMVRRSPSNRSPPPHESDSRPPSSRRSSSTYGDEKNDEDMSVPRGSQTFLSPRKGSRTLARSPPENIRYLGESPSPYSSVDGGSDDDVVPRGSQAVISGRYNESFSDGMTSRGSFSRLNRSRGSKDSDIEVTPDRKLSSPPASGRRSSRGEGSALSDAPLEAAPERPRSRPEPLEGGQDRRRSSERVSSRSHGSSPSSSWRSASLSRSRAELSFRTSDPDEAPPPEDDGRGSALNSSSLRSTPRGGSRHTSRSAPAGGGAPADGGVSGREERGRTRSTANKSLFQDLNEVMEKVI
jgi:hypothetical protein